ncbi:MAG: SHOCT domain-containing protein [Anaerolineae bacterium]|nr:SHOCT domain-containing protein [Anaerolineae bacterium]
MMNFGMWGGGALSMILFWIVVVVLAILVLRGVFGVPRGRHEQAKVKRSPAALVQARYARGEISREEYQTILNDLKEMQ